MDGLNGLVVVIGYSAISITTLVWLGAMLFNYFLLFPRDSMFEELPTHQKFAALFSGPLFLYSVHQAMKQCSKCKRFVGDCICDHETNCRPDH